MLKNGCNNKEIRMKFNITPSMLYSIKNEITWKHVKL